MRRPAFPLILSFSRQARLGELAALECPHPLADAVILSCELAKASSTGRGLG